MPAPVQDAEMSDASSPPHRKSNAWPNEERDDIYNRRQQGEKWDTICVVNSPRPSHVICPHLIWSSKDYPHRSKHAMQQQYSVSVIDHFCKFASRAYTTADNEKTSHSGNSLSLRTQVPATSHADSKQKTPTKGRGRRKGKPPALTSPTVMNSVKKVSKRRTSPEDADDQSDSDSDGESTPSVPTQPTGGYDGAPEAENDSESTKEPDSARKQRLRRRVKPTSDDEDEPPVSTRPKRTRASGINYSLLQNSGYGLEDQADEAAIEPAPDAPVRKSKIIALKMGMPKTPIVDDARKPRKSLKIDVNDEDTSARRSQRVKKVVNGKTGNLGSPLSHTADEETNVLGGKRNRRSLLLQEPDMTIDDDSDVRATRSSKKRKNSEIETNEAHPENVAAMESENKDQPSRKKKRHAKPKEHLGFLPNGQPRLRRRRVSKPLPSEF
ncbi:MAG: hypothetical protein L6R42_000537 [Xanthoria sp. 1 TBL-2021]|nr:MAG: hypothetical protein L6R42_000537 [Xanthoria sp. 1 TBL-2021]